MTSSCYPWYLALSLQTCSKQTLGGSISHFSHKHSSTALVSTVSAKVPRYSVHSYHIVTHRCRTKSHPRTTMPPPSTILPRHIFNTYKQYKADTSEFISWLVQAAHNCTKSSTSAKSKSRGKKGGNKGRGKATEATPTLRAQLLLAQAVAKSRIAIPAIHLYILKRVIKARTGCAKWFARRGGHRDHKASLESHAFANDIFQRILQILREYLSSSKLQPNHLIVYPTEGSRAILPNRDRSSFSPEAQHEEDRDIIYGEKKT